MQKRNTLSRVALIFACVFITGTAFFFGKWKLEGSMALISWDISGYYMYLPAFFYDDPARLDNRQYIIDNYHPCDNFLPERIGPTGKYVMKYSAGMAIMYLPGFAVAHIYAKLGGYPVDGFSYPYQFCMAMYSLLIMFAGLCLVRKLLLLYFSDVVAAFTVVALVLATNYLEYAAIANMFSHGYLFTLYALIIYLTIKWHKQYTYTNAAAIGALCGLCALIRPTDVISILIPLVWGVSNLVDVKNRLAGFFVEWRKVLLMFASAIAVGAVQLIYWRVFAGHWLYWSYGDDDGLNFLKLHIWNCLFSYRKGWFMYTPFMILSLAGFVTLYRKSKELFWTCFVFMFVALYIVFSWKAWAYGGSFSMRAVVQYYAILIFPLASLVEFCFKRIGTTLVLLFFFFFCTWLNLVMHWQANGGDNMDCNNQTRKYYWSVFGQLHSDKKLKKFLDTDEEIPTRLIPSLQELSNTVFCKDTLTACDTVNGQRAYKIAKQVDFVPETRLDISGYKGKWVRITCEAFVKKGGENYSKSPRLYAWITDGNFKNVKEKSYRMQIIAPYMEWADFTIDIFVPNEEDVTYLKAGVFNPGGEVEIFVKGIKTQVIK